MRTEEKEGSEEKQGYKGLKTKRNCPDLLPPAPGLDIVGVRLSPKFQPYDSKAT